MKEKNSSTTALGSFQVKDGNPPKVDTFLMRALPPGAVIEKVTIDAAERKKVIDGINADLLEFYVDAPLAQQMANALTAHESKGDYNSIADGNLLAARLLKDLQEVSHDRHLHVDFSPFKTPEKPEHTADDDARFHREMDQMNCMFDKVEILPNNIAYIKFDAFMDAAYCGPTVVAAMGFVAHSDAIIFDLRENGGGQPAMVTLIASYLFDQPTHLIDIYNRKENTTTQNWTLSYLPGQRLTKQPVFVLTARRTFSGAEEFVFDLKNQKRATIVGETTGGGAHPVSGHTVADYFMIGVPFAKSLDPVTKLNWEGIGVEPDVKVPAPDALTTAQKLALEKIRAGKVSK